MSTDIESLDARYADLRQRFIAHGTHETLGASLAEMKSVLAQLDALRPERRGRQYRPPSAERMERAADNFFNT